VRNWRGLQAFSGDKRQNIALFPQRLVNHADQALVNHADKSGGGEFFLTRLVKPKRTRLA
jgi:hypothetical protein